jgi:thiol-disulfide isomerase/thioredoxin
VLLDVVPLRRPRPAAGLLLRAGRRPDSAARQEGRVQRGRGRRGAPALKRLIACAAGLFLLATGLSACNDLQASGDKAFVSGDGRVRTIALDQRSDVISFDGTDLDGKPLSLADYRGKPVVIVVWAQWCTYCRAEAADVQQVSDALKGKAQFVGIDLSDPSPEVAQAYVRQFGVDYPSFYSPDGEAMLAFPGVLSIRSIPAFVVLDSRGRVAGSIMGQLPGKQTLIDIVDQVAGEQGGTVDG